MNVQDIASVVSKEIVTHKKPVQSPEVLVLMGLQYSGKSYLAEKLEEHNYVHFWATKIKKRFEIANPEMLEIALKVLDEVVTNKYNLVIDFTNHKRQIRERFQNATTDLHTQYRVVFLDIPREERLRRRQENAAKGDIPGRRVISLEQMKEFEEALEMPSDNENALHLISQADIDVFLGSL